MKRLVLIVLYSVLGAFCQEMSEELKGKIKEALCEAQCLDKAAQSSTCSTSRCNCSTDTLTKQPELSRHGMGPLTEPQLLCKGERLLSFKWELKQPLIYLLEYRSSYSKIWKLENMTSCSSLRINKLESSTSYQIRLWGISAKGDLFGPYNSTWVKTNPAGYTPKPVVQLHIDRLLLVEEYYTATVKWEPAEDRACFYDFMWVGYSNGVDFKQKEITKNDELFQTEISHLEFGMSYTLEMASKSGDRMRESNKTTIHINIPTCLEAYNNLTRCPPPEPQHLQAQTMIVTDKIDVENATYDVNVSWSKPTKLIPDNYTVHVFVLGTNAHRISQSVAGNVSTIIFGNVSLSAYYQVGIEAHSKGGSSKIAIIDRQLKVNVRIAGRSPFWSDSTHIPIVLGSTGGVVGLALIIYVVLYRRCTFKLAKRQSENMISKYYNENNFKEKSAPSENNTTTEYYEPEIIFDQWQLDPKKISVDDLLGSGAFGVVHKGYLEKEDGKRVEVAIKMLKGDPDGDKLLQFEREIEIMKCVGSHAHLVSLLGYCPKSDFRSPFLVVEYCAKGDLQTYLLAVWNQISQPRYVNSPSLPDDADVKTENHVYNKVYELLDELLEPRDLLSFARQICMGMEYLSSVRVVHRDLATRNVLMCGDRTVKVADFGLSRDVYQDNIYTKTGSGKLPVKWMAIESLSHQQYTTQSDVWSFGIVLWEIVTLGGNPYSGILTQNLLSLLKGGYRMECPQNCSKELYQIMRMCWKEVAKERPTFSDLRKMLEKLLENENRYINLDIRR